MSNKVLMNGFIMARDYMKHQQRYTYANDGFLMSYSVKLRSCTTYIINQNVKIGIAILMLYIVACSSQNGADEA